MSFSFILSFFQHIIKSEKHLKDAYNIHLHVISILPSFFEHSACLKEEGNHGWRECPLGFPDRKHKVACGVPKHLPGEVQYRESFSRHAIAAMVPLQAKELAAGTHSATK